MSLTTFSHWGSLPLSLILAASLVVAPACRGQQRDEPGAAQPAAVGAPRADGMRVRVLDNTGFTIGYAPERRSAVWVEYRARAVPQGGHYERPRFQPDPRVADPVAGYAYSDTRYDRGHLAPNYLISRLHGRAAQKQTFLMTNIVPQRGRLNQLVWQRLEEIEVDHMAPALERLRVTVGPVFGNDSVRLDDGPAIPTAFYRLWLGRTPDGDLRAMAFLVPQSVRGDERLDRYIVSVDRVERETGLDFYPQLAGSLESRIESRTADAAAWGFAEHACRPARYADDWRGRGGIELRFDRCSD